MMPCAGRAERSWYCQSQSRPTESARKTAALVKPTMDVFLEDRIEAQPQVRRKVRSNYRHLYELTSSQGLCRSSFAPAKTYNCELAAALLPERFELIIEIESFEAGLLLTAHNLSNLGTHGNVPVRDILH